MPRQSSGAGMRRREFIAAARRYGLLADGARAQQPPMPVIGVLNPASPVLRFSNSLPRCLLRLETGRLV